MGFFLCSNKLFKGFFLFNFILKNLDKNLLKNKLDKIKFEKIYVKIKIILIYFHRIGFLEQISKG